MNPSELADKWLNGSLGRGAVYINEETAYSVAEQLVCQIKDADEKYITKIIARLLAKPTTCCGHPIVESGSSGYLGNMVAYTALQRVEWLEIMLKIKSAIL